MPQPPSWANPVVTRSRVVLELAAELVGASQQPLRQAKVLLRGTVGVDEWPLALFASATIEGVRAVADRQAALAIVNPSAMLTLAYRGNPPFTAPQPVRTLAVIPSADQCLFVAHPRTGLRSLDEVKARRYPLRVRTRGTREHSLGLMIGALCEAGGFTLDELRGWGGDVRFDGEFPTAGGPELRSLLDGEVDAIFEEGLDEWLTTALEAGMVPLRLPERAVAALEARGYRRATIDPELYPGVGDGVLSIDFSGWPIFVHAELPDRLVGQLCAALEARKALIPWQGEGPLPIERMCSDSAATPIDVPFHPAAERYWRERGYR